MTPENIKKRLQYWAARGNKVCGPALLYIKKLEAGKAEICAAIEAGNYAHAHLLTQLPPQQATGKPE